MKKSWMIKAITFWQKKDKIGICYCYNVIKKNGKQKTKHKTQIIRFN